MQRKTPARECLKVALANDRRGENLSEKLHRKRPRERPLGKSPGVGAHRKIPCQKEHAKSPSEKLLGKNAGIDITEKTPATSRRKKAPVMTNTKLAPAKAREQPPRVTARKKTQ